MADQIADTQAGDTGLAREAIAAMNVVDGRKLIEHVVSANDFTYPFGLTDLPRGGAPAEAVLTDAQKTQWKEMLGPPFELGD